MKEIGGYIEFETYHGDMLHDSGIKLNCGRNCLAYLIVARKIKKIVMPYFMCASVFHVCEKYGVALRFYHVDKFFRPESLKLEDDEWLYLMNFYGQMSQEEVKEYVRVYARVIVDYTHNYFGEPVVGADTIYTCRKFFGVPDGAILFTDAREPSLAIELDESFERVHYLLGRFERTASEFYGASVKNNEFFADEPIRRMSKLTENLLRGIDYDRVRKIRTENFLQLHGALENMNELAIRPVQGAFMYPLYVENAKEIKKRLISHKIYIPTLWPNVLEEMQEEDAEFKMVNHILPLPCDQRYGKEDMDTVISLLLEQ